MGEDGASQPNARPQHAAAELNAAEVEVGRLGFHRTFPQRSAKRVIYVSQFIVFAAVIAAIIWAVRAAPNVTFNALHLIALALFATAISFRLIAAASLTPVLSRLAAPTHWPVYTILCPLYREANVTSDLVSALDDLDYPKSALDVKLLVEGDDQETAAAALAVSDAPHIEVVIIPPSSPRTKPKALNIGLARAKGEYVAV